MALDSHSQNQQQNDQRVNTDTFTEDKATNSNLDQDSR